MDIQHDSFTRSVLGIDWEETFPLALADGESVRTASYSEAMAFYKEHFAEIYRTDGRPDVFLSMDFNPRKERYYHSCGDFFIFSDRRGPYGVFVGTLVDWGSYYFRNCSVLPSHQGGGRYQRLLRHLLGVLEAHGVERIEGDVSPANLGHIHILNKLQFNVTGLNLSERWGAVLHFTRFLSGKHESVFLDQFCEGVRPQLKKNQDARTLVAGIIPVIDRPGEFNERGIQQ